MSKPPVVKTKDLVKALQKAGFSKVRQTGSHVYLRHSDGRLTSVSVHPGTVPLGTMRAILEQTHLTAEKLKKFL
ncbi:type II toxin-antitoxin system HicA family toxin [Candidatus Microgenomates bacterium]|nr:type II toxin-antitoxin system HicA family toxin [Candidatus Microgenomates bacterium]